MVQHLKSYLFYGSYFCAIEYATRDDKDYFYCTVLKRKRKELVVHSTLESDSVEYIKNKIKSSWPIVLILNNNQVLTKNLSYFDRHRGDLEIIGTAFPNVDISNFYFEIIKTETTNIVSICRKSLVDDIIQRYISKKFTIVDFSLGNSGISSLIDYFETSPIYSSNSKIYLSGNNIISIEQTESIEKKVYDVNGLQISNQYLLSLAGALSILMSSNNNPTNFGKEKEELASAFKNSRFFSIFLKAGLVFILSVLLINFLYFNFYFEKVRVLEESFQANLKAKNDILHLKNEVDKSQKFVNDIFKNNSSRSSYYLNAMIHSLPKSILLSEFNFQPLKNRIKKDKPIHIEEKIINVSGTSNNSSAYSLWIKNLELSSWIKKIEVTDYSDVSKKVSAFSIKLYLKDE